MEPLNKHSFEEEWRRTMADASEQPPASVWDKIEQTLDETPERKGIFWLILNDNRLRIAAGLALIFSIGTLIYKNNIHTQNGTELASQTKNNKEKQTKSSALNSKIAKADSAGILLKNPVSIAQNEDFKNSSSKTEIAINTKRQNIDYKLDNAIDLIKNATLEKPDLTKTVASNTSLKPESSQSNSQGNDQDLVSKNIIFDAQQLNSKSKVKLPPNRLIRKLILDYEVAEVATIKPKREFWLGLQSGGGSFNPSLSGSDINAVASLAFESPYRDTPSTMGTGTVSMSPSDKSPLAYATPSNKTTASDGYRNGVTFGMKIAKNWSLESGLTYLRGNSYIESNTYSIDVNSGLKSTYFADYITNNTESATTAKVPNQAITTVANEATFLNRYEFVSIPIQAGFTFLAKKKFNLSLLAGASADVFIGNLIGGNANQNINSFAILPNEKVYKPLNISGLGTVRVNYRLQKNWLIYLGGQYQQGLGSLLLKSSNANLNLKQTGVQTGLNYKF